MNHGYAQEKLACLLRDLSNYNADEFRRQMVRIVNGATGSNIPDDCHLPDTANPLLAQRISELERKLSTAEENARQQRDMKALARKQRDRVTEKLGNIKQVWIDCKNRTDTPENIEALEVAIMGGRSE